MSFLSHFHYFYSTFSIPKAAELQAVDHVLVPDGLRVGPERAGRGRLPGGEREDVALRNLGRLEPPRAAQMRP